ncbi:MAG: hypothetical protein CL888_01690, partial [Dehalococcoidia bacterium]|nr:hypothetical protein [Dehalococcoidia bacterium]
MISKYFKGPVVIISRLILGAVFIYASIDKIQNPADFAKAINNYHVLPFGLENLMALALPWCLVYNSKSRFQMILGLVFTVLGILCCGFIAFYEAELSEQYGFLSGNLQMIIAI